MRDAAWTETREIWTERLDDTAAEDGGATGRPTRSDASDGMNVVKSIRLRDPMRDSAPGTVINSIKIEIK